MLATLLIAYISLHAATNKLLPSTRVTASLCLAIFLSAAIVCMLPLVGATGPYVHTSGGFCYLDFYDVAQSVIMLLICVPCIITVVALFGAAARGEWEKKN